MQTATTGTLMQEFRAVRRGFEARLRALGSERLTERLSPGGSSAREMAVLVAAWLSEAAERIPALQAGSPSRTYELDAFNAAALVAAEGWTPDQVLGAYRRSAGRFEAIAAELTDEDLDEEPDVRAWLESAARVMISEHLDVLAGVGDEASPRR